MAPVIQHIKKQRPDLKITIRSSAPHSKIIERLGADIGIQEVITDIGMIQASALEVLEQESGDAYEQFHQQWEQKIDSEARELEKLGANLVLANVPYLALAGAHKAGITSAALCSLNWADIYHHYFAGKRPEAKRIYEHMLAAYNSAHVFMKPAPSMPMPNLHNGADIGPLAQLGKNRKREITTAKGLLPDQRLVMISLGGMELPMSINQWPTHQGVSFIVPGSWNSRHPDTIHFEELNMPFADVLRSCDALIAKPGYGSFAEAACIGLPVLYLERKNWPEAEFLIRWLHQNGRCALLSENDFNTGHVNDMIDRLCETNNTTPVTPSGIEQASAILLNLLE
ncbi:MAG: hypothetical protein GXP17_01280 [Gammaproteobacteria bacterium]|nr:hypothetical protein [Gammaproteobacteria bacterium]